jgi:hypothetical protein
LAAVRTKEEQTMRRDEEIVIENAMRVQRVEEAFLTLGVVIGFSTVLERRLHEITQNTHH